MKPYFLAAMHLLAINCIAQTQSATIGNVTDVGVATGVSSATTIGMSSMVSCTSSCKLTPVRIFIKDETVNELDGAVYLTISISPSSAQTVSVNYKTINGSAKQLKDYTKVLGILSFLPGEAFKKITIPIVADNIPEPQENFFVELSNPVNATIADGLGTITINDVPAVASKKIPLPFSVSVMPNPSTGAFLISVPGDNHSPVKLEVYDAVGRLVLTTIQQGKSIRMGAEWGTGVYTVRVMQGDNVTSLQLVKL